MFTVVFGQRKWYCDCFTSPTGTNGTLPLPLSAEALTGPIWLENVGETVSAYSSGSTSITLLKPGWAAGQW